MDITIKIDCSNIFEFKQHLKCLLDQIKKEQKFRNLTDDDEFPGNGSFHRLSDNNCYGTHKTNILVDD